MMVTAAATAAVSSERGLRRAAWVVVLVVVAAHLLRAGSHLHGAAHRLYYSYASDIMIPVAAYFILYLGGRNLRFLRDRRARAATVLAAATLAETLQGLGLPALGRTFDPVDLLCYGVGTGLAVVLELIVINRVGDIAAAAGPPGNPGPGATV